MKKILWLCSKAFSEKQIAGNGSWLQPLAEQLQASGKVRIINVAIGPVRQVQRQDCGQIEQWIIPKRRWKGAGQIPPIITCREVAEIERIVAPDLVHIWGTEDIWASIHARGYIKSRALLDMQGILSSYYHYYYGGLTLRERLQCIHLKEILMPWRNLYFKRERFHRRGELEKRHVGACDHILYQSKWIMNQLTFINTNPNTLYLPTKLILRPIFYQATPWQPHLDRKAPVIFSSCAAAVAYKGVHSLIKAVALLKSQYPDIQLRLAGSILVGKRLKDGYSIFLKKLIHRLGLDDNVELLGNLTGEQIVLELQHADVYVVPSYVENYCVSYAESMFIGTPTVCTFMGGLPEFATHGKEVLFYNPLDSENCAAYIRQLFTDNAYAKKLSESARARRMPENSIDIVIENQLNIYNTIMGQ